MNSVVQQRLKFWDGLATKTEQTVVSDFCKWHGKTKEHIVTEYYCIDKPQMIQRWRRDYGTTIYNYYKWLRQKGYKHNSARRMAFTVSKFLKKTCESIIFETKISRGVESTKIEHEFLTEQLKQMFLVGNIEQKAILQTGVNLGFRVNDFLNLPREPFIKAINDVKAGAKTPYLLKLETQKEAVIAHAMLTKNTLDVLDQNLKTAPQSTKLFDKTERQLNYMIKSLWKKAFPQHKAEAKNVFWHLLRKYFVTMALGAGVDSTLIKFIVGKRVDTSFSTYCQRIKPEKEFQKVLSYIELSSYISVEPRTYEEQQAIIKMLVETVKQLTDQVEELTGKRPQVLVPTKQKMPTPEELADILNNGNNSR